MDTPSQLKMDTPSQSKVDTPSQSKIDTASLSIELSKSYIKRGREAYDSKDFKRSLVEFTRVSVAFGGRVLFP